MKSELLKQVKNYRELQKLILVSESQASRLFKGTCTMSPGQIELLRIKLGGDVHVK